MFRVFPQTLIQRMTGLMNYLQTRTDMHSLAYLNKQNKKSLLATEGTIQMALFRHRTLQKLQLRAYDDIQLFRAVSSVGVLFA